MYRENRFFNSEKKTKTTLIPTLYTNEGSIKLININLQSHCNETKRSPVDAEFNCVKIIRNS